MTTDRRLTGTTDDFVRILASLDERSEALDNLSGQLEANTRELIAVREALTVRPTGRQIEYRRRRAIAGLVLFALAVIFLHDEHVEKCGPGSRINAQAVDPNVKPPNLCDVTFPLHPHADGRIHPTGYNLLGMGIYAGSLGLLVLWVRAPRRGAEQDN